MQLTQLELENGIRNHTLRVVPAHNGLVSIIAIHKGIEQPILKHASSDCDHELVFKNARVTCKHCHGYQNYA